jgi:signal recognition particle receptor subunit beta
MSTIADKACRHAELADAPVLVLANKQDLPGCLDADQVAAILQLHRYTIGPTPRAVRVQSISALTGYVDTLVSILRCVRAGEE